MSAVALKSFGFGDQLVRVIDSDGAAWFVAHDVCSVLEIAHTGTALRRLDDDEKGVHSMHTLRGNQDMVIVSESGLYALTFTSRKEAAKRFRRWVTQEVLPAIRTTGRYEIANDEPDDFAMPGMPDDFERLRMQLALVKEARIAFGVRGARDVWRKVGLPELAAEPSVAEMLTQGSMSRLHLSIAQWMEARTEAAPGHREGSMVLYHDYLDWAKANDLPRDEIVSLTSFSRALSSCGISNMKSNRVHKVGLRLRPALG